jgi:lincosamide nucleotidyltransferase A/C/D/E
MLMTMTAADVVEILGWLRAANADVWLDGGWGVDALVGEQTREHKDLDLIVRDAHEPRMREVLATHSFIQVRGVPQNFVLADERGREVDVHTVRFDDQGNGHLLSEDGEPFGHSTEAFAAMGRVSGYRVACLSADAQMSNHSWGYEPGDTDVHDMRLLHDRLGTPSFLPTTSPWRFWCCRYGTDWRAAWFLAISAGTHALVDRRWPTRLVLRSTGSKDFATVFWGVIATDQALHLSILAISVFWLAR